MMIWRAAGTTRRWGPDTALADFIRIIFMHAKLHLRDLMRGKSTVSPTM